jgi:hypothetical protein
MRVLYTFIVVVTCFSRTGFANQKPDTPASDSLILATARVALPLLVDADADKGIQIATKNLQSDIGRIAGLAPEISTNAIAIRGSAIIIGTVESPLVKKLISENKVVVTDITGKWEAYSIQVVKKPTANIPEALVIIGSDKRGVIFGIYEVSKQIGVSPWHWWADVPVKKKESISFSTTRQVSAPAVKYRGIFINDEAPALSGWAIEKFGGFNHKFYEKVFELILRLKGNFLWPAMWGRAIYDDDSLSAPLANDYGVVIGTSHHEPMMRAHVEWQRYGKGDWNYEKNENVLREFWTRGVQRMEANESIITLGMRGDGDMAMTRETNVALLEKIVADQRKIINDVTKKNIETVPQAWALYKEVQDYYDEGMRVPDDVTLLLCDDNWGNIRKLPTQSSPSRKGGYGVYYHFDYVGGPRNYKWLNTNQIERTWEQMKLAYDHGVDRIWIVNVGDIKPMEFPISFFLDMAWNPGEFTSDNLSSYYSRWSETQFGKKYATETGELIKLYTKFNARRKPELLDANSYSLLHYCEFENVVNEYSSLAKKAEIIYTSIAPEYKDAFYQLVLFPIQACANLNELYFTVAKNKLYASQGRATTNVLAAKAEQLYNRDAALTIEYNTKLASGKWNHMMDQTHIGYTYWQQPEKNKMPEVQKIEIGSAPALGIAVEGSSDSWPKNFIEASLPTFDSFSKQIFYFEIFNRGSGEISYTVKCDAPWILLSGTNKKTSNDQRVSVSIDWKKAPMGTHKIPIQIESGKDKVTVVANVINHGSESIQGFVEANGYVSMEAEHYSRAVASEPFKWRTIKNLGRTLSGVTLFPNTHNEIEVTKESAHLEYDFTLTSSSEGKIYTYFSPTLNFHNQSLRYAISVDDERPQIINLHEGMDNSVWEKWVADNVIIKSSAHTLKAGKHVLKIWLIDPGVVIQKLVIDTGGLEESYLGPPESVYIRSDFEK